MKAKQLITIFMILACFNVFGQQSKKESAPQNDAQKELIQNLQSKIDEQQGSILKLQEETMVIKSDLQNAIKTISDYKNEIKYYSDKNHTDISHWFSWLALIVTFVSIACPVIVNLSYKKYYFDKQADKLQEEINSVKENVKSAKEDADSAKKSLSKTNELKNNVDEIKESVEKIKKETDKNKKDAERAAKRAMASKLFTQALSEKDPIKAIELYSKSIAINPSAEAYNNRGVLKSDLDDSEGAIKDYEKAIELDPDDACVYYNRGISKNEMNDYEGAMRDYDKALELDSKYSIGYNNRGILKKDLGDVEGAMEDYNKAIELDPNYAKAYNNRADLWLIKGEIDKALDDASKSIVLDNSVFVSFVTRGEIYCADKQYDLAIEDFTRALTLNNKIKEAYEHRAICYKELANQNPTNKADLLAKAEADEEKAKSLGDEE